MSLRSTYCLTPSSVEMTCKAVVLHSNDVEIHTRSIGSASVIVIASEGFLHSKIT